MVRIDSEKRILRCSEGKNQIWIDMMRIEPLLEGGLIMFSFMK